MKDKHSIARRAVACLAVATATLTASADVDITKYFLKNYDFDKHYDYAAGSYTTVSQEIRDIRGWTADLSADYTVTGVYEFGFKGKFNNTSVPSQGYDGEAGGALALSTGWGQTFCYYQTVTLPAGTYTITAPTYNGKSVTGGTSMLAWVPNGGTEVRSTVTSYPGNAWTNDAVTFTLTYSTTGKIRIGYQAAGGASTSSAGLLIDYVRLTTSQMRVVKRTITTTARNLYGTGTGNGAEALKTVWDEAAAVFDNSESTEEDIIAAYYRLTDACEEYRLLNATEEKPIVRTEYIDNPSFETNGTSGWTVSGMNTQSNSVFNGKSGTYYVEAWVNIGEQIGSASITQTIQDLPRGRYKLMANALHVQQNGSSSIINKGEPQTGAYLFAGNTKTEITSSKQYAVTFAVVDSESDVEIGLRTDNATGNYLCLDNFILQYIGTASDADRAEELLKLVARGEAVLESGIQNSVAGTLRSAIEAARTAAAGTGTDADGKTIYDTTAMSEATTTLENAIADGEASRARYDALQARIDYAETVYGWWEGTSRKTTSLNNLNAAIISAKSKVTDYSLTNTQLTSNVTILNQRIAAVDKKIYCSTNACGTEEQLNVSTNQWCYARSMQSKHWILFWEAGYGTSVPAAVPSILDNADKIFELYADSLKYITINQGSSKTDTYKMIIRLRYTTEWEASGSGIDDQIGLLTLSNGAHTSRSGQTVAHEIGHCFQYQTHCDNGNWNGWMYNWGNSTLNVFWEMCAQWQAYKYYPAMQFDNEWLYNTINGLHRHPLCVDLRYNNYFIQDFFCHKHGMDFLGKLWNKSQYPEDPLQAYMRLTMEGTSAEKLDRLGDEMWEYGARMTTFDMDPIRDYGTGRINYRNQTALNEEADGYWSPTAANCIENFGNNAIRLNVPTTAKTLYAEFTGEAGKDGYTAYNTTSAGWKLGFVALKRDGTRLYGDIATATYDAPTVTASFDCPAGCEYLWLVVSGAPTSYWTRDWLSWAEESTAEQWPYRVKLHQTNVYGKANNNSYPTGIRLTEATGTEDDGDVPMYDLNGRRLDNVPTSGIYIRGGKKYMK